MHQKTCVRFRFRSTRRRKHGLKKNALIETDVSRIAFKTSVHRRLRWDWKHYRRSSKRLLNKPDNKFITSIRPELVHTKHYNIIQSNDWIPLDIYSLLTNLTTLMIDIVTIHRHPSYLHGCCRELHICMLPYGYTGSTLSFMTSSHSPGNLIFSRSHDIAVNLLRWVLLHLIDILTTFSLQLLNEYDTEDMECGPKHFSQTLIKKKMTILDWSQHVHSNSNPNNTECDNKLSFSSNTSTYLMEILRLSFIILDSLFLVILPYTFTTSLFQTLPKKKIEIEHCSYPIISSVHKEQSYSEPSLNVPSASINRKKKTHQEYLKTMSSVHDGWSDVDENEYSPLNNCFYSYNLKTRKESFLSLLWLSTIIEHLMVFGSGLGCTHHGIWSSGFYFRLAITHLLNKQPILSLSGLRFAQHITEGYVYSIQASDLRNRFENQSSLSSVQLAQNTSCPTSESLLLLTVHILINDIHDYSEAIKTCQEWLEKHNDTQPMSITPVSLQPTLQHRIEHLLGLAYLGHALNYLPYSTSRQQTLEKALYYLQIAVDVTLSSDLTYCWKMLYHYSLILTYLGKYKDACYWCIYSIRLFSGYPGSWGLFASLLSLNDLVYPAMLNKDLFFKPLNWESIIHQGLMHCKGSSFLLLLFFIGTTTHCPEYDPYRYFNIRREETTIKNDINIHVPLSYSPLVLQHFYPNTSGQVNHMTNKKYSIPLPSFETIHFEMEVLQALHFIILSLFKLPLVPIQTIMQPSPRTHNTSDFSSTFLNQLFIKIDALPDDYIACSVLGLNDSHQKDTSRISNTSNGSDWYNAALSHNISLGQIIRNEYTSGITPHESNFQHYNRYIPMEQLNGLPIATLHDINHVSILTNYGSNDNNKKQSQTQISGICQLFYWEDALSPSGCFFLIIDALCALGQLQSARYVLNRFLRLLQISSKRPSKTGSPPSSDLIQYEISFVYILFCETMQAINNNSSEGSWLLLYETLQHRLMNALLLSPYNSRLLQINACIYIFFGNIAAAQTALQRILQLDQSDITALRLLAECETKLQLHEKAFETACLALEMEQIQMKLPYTWLPIYYP